MISKTERERDRGFHPLDSIDIKNLKALTIEKVAERSFKILLYTFAAATFIACAAAIVIPSSPLISLVLTVSATGLAILLTQKAISKAMPYLPRSLQVAVHLVQSIATEAFALMAVIALLPFKLSSKTHEIIQQESQSQDQDQSQVPILFIHGFLHNSSCGRYHEYLLGKAAEEAEKAGQPVSYGPTFAVDLSPFGSIKDHTEIVEEKIREIRTQYGYKKINLICHSMGGIVAANYLRTHHEDQNIDKVVTLGTPFHGTPMAYLAPWSSAAWNMRWGCDFLEKLREDMKRSKTTYCHIGSDYDAIVPNSDSPYVKDNKGDNERHRIEGWGHLGLLKSDEVFRHIFRFLQKPSTETEENN